ncbi:polysaccharide deacetylase family protein [Clostridium sp.]|uniref:polysaccharide deacetylase family protein n=1 Tax=Clostridium sp. TaxID=1506 RepID=UPI002635113B|nr:polysaccharide deacetylase family protein [Clostridium sp.]
MLNKIKKFSILFLLILIVFPFDSNIWALETEKSVYLTFDDGPGGKITKNILDVLNKEKVTATFFVIGCQIDGQEDIIKKMYEDGHAIGLHSFSHCRNKIYSSKENFLEEMFLSQETIFNITSEKPTILRFPFGCNNKTYKLNEPTVNLLHENDLKIYDWNVDSGDGANSNLPVTKIISNSCVEKDNVILLMHCSYTNKNTALALPSIIKYYKDNNYTFKVIDNSTKEVYKIIK